MTAISCNLCKTRDSKSTNVMPSNTASSDILVDQIVGSKPTRNFPLFVDPADSDQLNNNQTPITKVNTLVSDFCDIS